MDARRRDAVKRGGIRCERNITQEGSSQEAGRSAEINVWGFPEGTTNAREVQRERERRGDSSIYAENS